MIEGSFQIPDEIDDAKALILEEIGKIGVQLTNGEVTIVGIQGWSALGIFGYRTYKWYRAYDRTVIVPKDFTNLSQYGLICKHDCTHDRSESNERYFVAIISMWEYVAGLPWAFSGIVPTNGIVPTIVRSLFQKTLILLYLLKIV